MSIKNKSSQDYIDFLRQTKRVYCINSFPWVEYHGHLRPVISFLSEPPKLKLEEVKNLLKLSKLPFAVWSSNFKNEKTEWWWVVIRDSIDIGDLKNKTRDGIKRGLKNCQIKKVTAEWLLVNGYDCYKKAFKRYKNAKPVNKETFKRNFKNKIDKPFFDFFAIFFQDKLIGYAENTIINDTISFSVLKYDPDYLKYYSSYALIYTMLDYYLNENKYKLVTNGTRSINHITEVQEYLEKFGFKKEYCQLNIVYAPFFGLLVRIAYPFKKIINILYKIIPINFFHKISVILKQEEIRRSFQ